MTEKNYRPVAALRSGRQTERSTTIGDSIPLTDPSYDEDLFGELVEPAQREIPRRGSAGYEQYLNELPLPNGWTYSSLAPTMPRQPAHIESIWVRDDEGEFRHLFVDQVTGQEWHFDPELARRRGNGWSQ